MVLAIAMLLLYWLISKRILYNISVQHTLLYLYMGTVMTDLTVDSQWNLHITQTKHSSTVEVTEPSNDTCIASHDDQHSLCKVIFSFCYFSCNKGWNWSKDLNKQKIFHLTDKLLQANMAASSGLRENVYPIIFLAKMLVYVILLKLILLLLTQQRLCCNKGWNWSKDLNKQKNIHLTDKLLQANMAASSGLREMFTL